MAEWKTIEDYEAYVDARTLPELIDIIEHIDTGRYPERYGIVTRAITTRRERGESDTPSRQITGFGGWLIVFCGITNLLTPISAFWSLMSWHGKTRYLFTVSPKIKYVFYFQVISVVILTLFGFYVGILLIRLNKNALQYVIAFLWTYLIFRVTACLIPILIGLPWSFLPNWKEHLLRNGATGLIFFAIWYSYFKRSKRIKNTWAHAG